MRIIGVKSLIKLHDIYGNEFPLDKKKLLAISVNGDSSEANTNIHMNENNQIIVYHVLESYDEVRKLIYNR